MNTIEVSTDNTKLNIPLIHDFLTNSYWANGRTFEQVKKSIDNTFCFGIYLNEEQIGFARVLTDKTLFAYLTDVFIVEQHRGKGYSKLLMEKIMNHEELQPSKSGFWQQKTPTVYTSNTNLQQSLRLICI